MLDWRIDLSSRAVVCGAGMLGAGPDATPSGLSHRLSSHRGGLRERKRVKNLGRAKRPSPALGATALSGGGRFLGKPTIAEGTTGQDGYG